MDGEKVAVKYENWLRILTFIHFAGWTACKHVLHNLEHLPINAGQLYNALKAKESQFKKLRSKNIIKQNQYDLIFPANGLTDISKWDITLFTLVIRVMFGKQKYQMLVDELRDWRNENFHKGKVWFSKNEFNQKWNDLLHFFGQYGVNVNRIAKLKKCSLDKKSQYWNAYLDSKLLQNNITVKASVGKLLYVNKRYTNLTTILLNVFIRTPFKSNAGISNPVF